MGPLAGLRIIELSGLGPGPFCGLLLSNLGAEVITVLRPDRDERLRFWDRGKRLIRLDLKKSEDVAKVIALCEHADILLEAFRPGVAERLGLGPQDCLLSNPKLIYGRLTGYGQTGPMASKASHDINFTAFSGYNDLIRGNDGEPVYTLNILGDFGAGSLNMALSLLACVIETQKSGKGQVIDLSIADSMLYLCQQFMATKYESEQARSNAIAMFQGRVPFYRYYKTQDNKYMAVGSIEDKFYQLLISTLGLAEDPSFSEQWNPTRWDEMSEKIAEVFVRHSQSHWTEVFNNVDACVSPVYAYDDIKGVEHYQARGALYECDGLMIPAVVPKFSRTPCKNSKAFKFVDQTDDVLREFGLL